MSYLARRRAIYQMQKSDEGSTVRQCYYCDKTDLEVEGVLAIGVHIWFCSKEHYAHYLEWHPLSDAQSPSV